MNRVITMHAQKRPNRGLDGQAGQRSVPVPPPMARLTVQGPAGNTRSSAEIERLTEFCEREAGRYREKTSEYLSQLDTLLPCPGSTPTEYRDRAGTLRALARDCGKLSRAWQQLGKSFHAPGEAGRAAVRFAKTAKQVKP